MGDRPPRVRLCCKAAAGAAETGAAGSLGTAAARPLGLAQGTAKMTSGKTAAEREAEAKAPLTYATARLGLAIVDGQNKKAETLAAMVGAGRVEPPAAAV
jgi:hypothetical protein